MLGKVYIVGVGPGSPAWLTERAKEIIRDCDIVAGYKHTLQTVSQAVSGKELIELTLKTQIERIAEVKLRVQSGASCMFACTGDPMFSDSEFVDRIVDNFPGSEIVPGISSIQLASALLNIPVDEALILTFHVSGDIEGDKGELLTAVKQGRPVILLPRPWDFMPDSIAKFLLAEGIQGETPVRVLENLSLPNESIYSGALKEMAGKGFDALSVVVIGSRRR